MTHTKYNKLLLAILKMNNIDPDIIVQTVNGERTALELLEAAVEDVLARCEDPE